MGVFDGLPDIFVGTFGEPSLPAQYTPAGGLASPVVGIFEEPTMEDFADGPRATARVATFDCAAADLPAEAAPGEQSADVLEVSGFVAAFGGFQLRPATGGGVTRRFRVLGARFDARVGMVQLTLMELK